MKIAVTFDFHDLFVKSKEAWIEAFKQFDSSEKSISLLEEGVSRREIAKKLNIDYNSLLESYRQNLKSIEENISLLKQLSNYCDNYLISHSHKERLMKDIEKFELGKYFKDIFSSEDFEDLNRLLNKILLDGAYDRIIFFNHENPDFEEGGKIVYAPIDFKTRYHEFKDKSFVDHAKTKELYNSLPKKYHLALDKNTEREINFLSKIFKENNVKNIVDCGCGVGRHSVPLSKRGFDMTGVDISPNMLEVAKENSSLMSNINFIHQDIRDLNLDKKDYDAAICMWTTYNYLSTTEDLKDFFKGVSKHVRKGGLLILDAKNISGLEPVRAYTRLKRDERSEVFLLIIKKIIKNVQNGFYLYFIKEGEEDISFLFDEELAKFYSPLEIEKSSEDKFELIDSFGDFDFREFDNKNSERMILILKKK